MAYRPIIVTTIFPEQTTANLQLTTTIIPVTFYALILQTCNLEVNKITLRCTEVKKFSPPTHQGSNGLPLRNFSLPAKKTRPSLVKVTLRRKKLRLRNTTKPRKLKFSHILIRFFLITFV